MLVSQSDRERYLILELIKNNIEKSITVSGLAKIIGTLVACFPAVEYGQLFYRQLELQKIEALRVAYNYDRKIFMSEESKLELQ